MQKPNILRYNDPIGMKESAEGARREKPAIKDEWFTDPRVSEAAETLRTAQAALDALEASENGAGAEGADVAAVRERVRSAHEHMARVWEEVSADKWRAEAPAEDLVDPVEAARTVYHAKRAEYNALKEQKGADDSDVLALKKLLPGFAAKIAAAGRKAKRAEAGTGGSADADAGHGVDTVATAMPELEVPPAQLPGTELVPVGGEEAVDADAGGLADVHARLSEELAGVHRALASIERAADVRGGADPSAEAEQQQFLARREQLTAALARIAARAAGMAEQGDEQPRKRATRQRASAAASPEAAATGSANTGKLDEMADDQAGLAPHPQEVAEERQQAVRRRRAEKSAEKGAERQDRHEGAAQQEARQEQRSAPEQPVRTGLFSDYSDRMSLYFESRRLGKDVRELERKGKRLATLEEELAALTGELDADDEQLQGIRRRHKLPDRAQLWRAKDEETLKRKEDRLRAQIDEARRDVERLQKRVEAREKAGVEIVERAAKRADAIIAPQQAQFTEVAKQVDEANDALARYRGMLEVTEREIAEMTDRQNNVTGVSAKKELAYLLQRHEVMHKRLRHHIDTWSVRVARLTEVRDRLGGRIAERAGVVEGMKQTLEDAARGGSPAEQAAAATASEASRPRSPELGRGDTAEFMRVWNGRYGESLPLDAGDLSNLVSSDPTYREIETAARLRLGWKRGLLWKLPIFSWLWNFRTNRKLRQMRSDFLKQPR